MQWPWSKSDAEIYVDEVRNGMDRLVVPIFTPDTALDVGDFGSFEDGRFVRRGNVQDRGIELDIEESPRNPFQFASTGKVKLGPSATVPNPAGGADLVQAKLTFSRSRAVAASFNGGVERSVRDADAFAETLARAWAAKTLKTDRMVVWSVRRATGGTVVISKQSNNEVDVSANSALLGPAVTLGGLSLGVTFGAETSLTWKTSDPTGALVIWVRLFKLDEKRREAVDGFGFEEGDPEFDRHAAEIEPVAVGADELLGQLRQPGY